MRTDAVRGTEQIVERLAHLFGIAEVPRFPVRGDWVEQLDTALASVGLKAAWMRADSALVLQEARPDLPLVTWEPGPQGGRYITITGSHFNKIRTMTSDTGIERWVDAEQILGDGTRTWARVMPVLPASPLVCEGATPMRRLLRLLRAEWTDIGVVVVFAVTVGVLSLATPLAIQLLINWLAFGALLQPIVSLGIGLVVILTLVAVLGAAQRHAVEIVQRRIFARTVTDLAARLSRVRVEAFDGTYGPELANRFFDVLTVQKAANALLLDGLSAALQAGVGLLLLAFYHPYLLLFDVVVVSSVVFVLFGLSKGAEETAIIESKKKYATAAWLEEIARHPETFKLGGGRLAEERTDALAAAYLDARHAHFRVFFRQVIGMQAISVLLPSALLVMTGYLVLEGQLTLGQLVAAEFIVASALAGVAKFTGKLETVYDLLAGVDKLGALFDLPLELDRGAPAPQADGPAEIRLEASTGRAPGGHIGPIDLTLARGSRTVVLADTGIGAHLLAQMVVGTRRACEGSVLRDGVPIDSTRPRAVYDTSMMLSHEGLFGGTIRDNLDMGCGTEDAKLWAALEAVGIAERVRALPDALETELTADGQPLSRVQIRGLYIARALVAGPRLLVVDTVLDGLPSVQRERWLALLLDSRAPWTLLITTHEPQIALRAPDAYQLREGKLHVRPNLTAL